MAGTAALACAHGPGSVTGGAAAAGPPKVAPARQTTATPTRVSAAGLPTDPLLEQPCAPSLRTVTVWARVSHAVNVAAPTLTDVAISGPEFQARRACALFVRQGLKLPAVARDGTPLHREVVRACDTAELPPAILTSAFELLARRRGDARARIGWGLVHRSCQEPDVELVEELAERTPFEESSACHDMRARVEIEERAAAARSHDNSIEFLDAEIEHAADIGLSPATAERLLDDLKKKRAELVAQPVSNPVLLECRDLRRASGP